MATKKGRQLDFSNAPQNLDHHPFFGLQLDEDQLQFANAIWSSDNDIIFVDAAAGSGKTTVAVSTAVLLCKYGCEQRFKKRRSGKFPVNVSYYLQNLISHFSDTIQIHFR